MTRTTVAPTDAHRPAELTPCADRDVHERRQRLVQDGLGWHPAATPIAHRHDDGVQHAEACPAPDHGPCLDGLLGGRGW